MRVEKYRMRWKKWSLAKWKKLQKYPALHRVRVELLQKLFGKIKKDNNKQQRSMQYSESKMQFAKVKRASTTTTHPPEIDSIIPYFFH